MHSSSNVAVLVGLDGWHLSRETLATFPNSEEAFARRGAHWTFDGDDYVRFVKQLRLSADVHAPSFSHSLKDPVHNDIHVLPHHKIVLIEGLYVFLSIDPWRVAGEMLDERWFVEVDMIDAMQRLVKRHIQTGVTATLDEAQRRGEENDFPSEHSCETRHRTFNPYLSDGEFVMQHMLSPTKRLKSVHDPSIAI